MSPVLRSFESLVDFLGSALGSNTEIALHDFENVNHSLVKIVNGHVSGRAVGAPATDLALRILHDAEERGVTFISGYESESVDHRPLRSASYIIREDDRVVGMMCLNTDISELKDLRDLVERVCALFSPQDGSPGSSPSRCGGPAPAAAVQGGPPASVSERLAGSSEELVRQSIASSSACADRDPRDLSPRERLEVVRELNGKGIFLLKGAVGDTAEVLGVSVPSVYRYLHKVR